MLLVFHTVFCVHAAYHNWSKYLLKSYQLILHGLGTYDGLSFTKSVFCDDIRFIDDKLIKFRSGESSLTLTIFFFVCLFLSSFYIAFFSSGWCCEKCLFFLGFFPALVLSMLSRYSFCLRLFFMVLSKDFNYLWTWKVLTMLVVYLMYMVWILSVVYEVEKK